MIGGSDEEVDAVRPVLDVVSCLVLHMGPPGAGLAAKLARNLITYGSWLAAFEAQELAEAAGIDLLKLGEATRESDKRIGGATRLMFRDHRGALARAAPTRACSSSCGPAPRSRTRTWPPSWRSAAELGVDLPLATLTERRCARIYGFEGDIRRSAVRGPTSVGSDPINEGSASDASQTRRRAAGMAKMQEVYGFTVDPADLPGRYTDMTVDHLFGTVWTDDTIDLRDRRLLTIGVLAAQDKPELLEIQFDYALERGELTVDAGPRGRGAPHPLHRLAHLHRHQRRGGDRHPAPRRGRRRRGRRARPPTPRTADRSWRESRSRRPHPASA